MKQPENPKDGNRLPRSLQEALDVFGKAYDEWCTAQSKVDSSFETFKEKQGKFEKLAAIFPDNLITPINAPYLKQVVRRARQNKYKRAKTAAAKDEKVQEMLQKYESMPVRKNPDETEEEETSEKEEIEKEESEEEEEEPELPPKKFRTINLPTAGTVFMRTKLFRDDFKF